MKNQEITEKIIGVFYDVYNELGHGFLEFDNDRKSHREPPATDSHG
jgi:hypothetical protein